MFALPVRFGPIFPRSDRRSGPDLPDNRFFPAPESRAGTGPDQRRINAGSTPVPAGDRGMGSVKRIYRIL
jgi:hypothetical protein